MVLFDQRNHGWNPPSGPLHHCYAQLARDLGVIARGIIAHLGAKPTVEVLHSLSVRAAIQHWELIVGICASSLYPAWIRRGRLGALGVCLYGGPELLVSQSACIVEAVFGLVKQCL